MHQLPWPPNEPIKCYGLGERKTVEKVNGWYNSTYLENTNPNKKAIHIHGGMEHNLDGYSKYYSCGS